MILLLGAIGCFILAAFNGRGWGHNIRAVAIGFGVTLVLLLLLIHGTGVQPPSY